MTTVLPLSAVILSRRSSKSANCAASDARRPTVEGVRVSEEIEGSLQFDESPNGRCRQQFAGIIARRPLLRFESATQVYSWPRRRLGIHCAAREINLGSIKLHKGKKTEICNWMASPERLSAARRRGCCRNESSRQSAAVEEWRAYSAGGGECFAPKLPMTAFAAPACKPCRNQAPAVSRPETGP